MQPLQRIRGGLASLVGGGQEPSQGHPRLVELAAPDESLAGDPLRRARDVRGSRRGGAEPLAEVVDRPPLEAARPGEPKERVPLEQGLRAGSRRQRLERPRLCLCDPLHPHSRNVLGHRGENGRTRRDVVAALGQRLLQIRLNRVVPPDLAAREQQVGAHSGSPRRKRENRRFEQLRDQLLLARDFQVARQLEQALVASVFSWIDRGWRRQPQGVLGQLDRRLRRPARRRARRGGGDRHGEGRIGFGSGESKVARAQLSRREHARQLAMKLAALGGSSLASHSRGKERVRGPDLFAVHDEHTRLDGEVERLGVGQRGELAHAKVRAQGDGEEEPPNLAGQARHPRAEQVLDRVGNGQVVADRRQRGIDELASDLEREQRIPEGRIEDAAEEMPRQRQSEPPEQDAPRRPEAQRADVQDLEPTCLERLLEGRRRPSALGEQNADVALVEPSRSVGERGGRRRVEPLEVVDRNEQRCRGCEGAQRPEEADRDRLRFRGRTGGGRSEQRHLERLELRSGQSRQLLAPDAVEEVDERRERELRLGVARPHREDAQALIASSGDSGLPELRLPESRSTGENEGARARFASEEAAQGVELGLAPDDLSARPCRRLRHRPQPRRYHSPRRAAIGGRTGTTLRSELDIFLYGYTMTPWHEQRRRRMRSTRSPSLDGGRSWTSSPAGNVP